MEPWKWISFICTVSCLYWNFRLDNSYVFLLLLYCVRPFSIMVFFILYSCMVHVDILITKKETFQETRIANRLAPRGSALAAGSHWRILAPFLFWLSVCLSVEKKKCDKTRDKSKSLLFARWPACWRSHGWSRVISFPKYYSQFRLGHYRFLDFLHIHFRIFRAQVSTCRGVSTRVLTQQHSGPHPFDFSLRILRIKRSNI